MICVVTSILITINQAIPAQSTAKVQCRNAGVVLVHNVVTGKASTPTKKGTFKPLFINHTGTGKYDDEGVAYQKHPDGSYYMIHDTDPNLNQKGSLGCVRIPGFKNFKFNANSKISIN